MDSQPALPARLPSTAHGVVFVHGMRTSSQIWDRQLDHVRGAGHQAVAVDLPAHGARHTQRFSMPGAFEVIDDAARSFAPGTPVVVVGLSLGGYTSLAWAAQHAAAPGFEVTSTTAGTTGTPTSTPTSTPSSPAAGDETTPDAGRPRLAGVVAAACTADPKGKPVALFRDVARATVAGRDALRRGATDVGRSWRTALTGGGGPAGGADLSALLGPTTGRSPRARARAHRPGWDVVTDSLTQLAGLSSVAHLRAIQVPVWLVNGARDQMRLEESRHLRATERGALVVVPRAGHDVNSDAPEAFNDVLTRALADFARA